jgi:hypothetical protein
MCEVKFIKLDPISIEFIFGLKICPGHRDKVSLLMDYNIDFLSGLEAPQIHHVFLEN